MTRARPASASILGTVLLGGALVAIAVAAWISVWRDAATMSMSGPAPPSLAEGARFVGQWGVMMAAMMLPSAAPMILLYRTVSRRLAVEGERVVPAPVFAAIYLFSWLLFGVPVYLASVVVGLLSAKHPSVAAAMPYAVAGVLIIAGLYQFTEAKRVCLRYCESPLGFLMRRWRTGYAATLRLAAGHSGYCIGCCWALMVILVAAGAMSLPWVVGITIVVFVEKVLPRGWLSARVVGVVLIALGLAVALNPKVAGTMRWEGMSMEHGQ